MVHRLKHPMQRQLLIPERALATPCYALGANRIGTDGNDKRYSGDSAVYDYLGNTILDCQDRACTESASLDGDALERYRNKFPAYLDADTFNIGN